MDKYISYCCLGSILCLVFLAGCNDHDERLAEFAQKSVEQQAQQNAALAKADEDLHVERSSLDQQQTALEADRREIATQRVRDPLVANALEAVGLVLACLTPLVICAYALKQAGSASAEEELGTILVHELTSERPQLLPTLDTATNLAADRWNPSLDPALLKHTEPSDGQ